MEISIYLANKNMFILPFFLKADLFIPPKYSSKKLA